MRPRASRVFSIGVLAIFALTIFAVGAAIWRDRSDTLEEGVRHARNVGIVISGQIARSIQSIEIVLRELQRRIDSLDVVDPSGAMQIPGPHGLQATLFQQLWNLPQALHIIVADHSGRIVLSTTSWPAPDINVGERDYFRELAENDDDRLTISTPFNDEITGESTIVFARRINGPGRALLGIVFISLKKSYFEGVFSGIASLPYQDFSMMRRDGALLVRYPDAKDWDGQKLSSASRFHAAVADGGGSYRAYGIFDSIVRWIAVNPLEEYPLVINVAVPEDAILRGWRERTMLVGSGTIVILVLAILLLSLAIRREAELRTQNRWFDATVNNVSHGLATFDRNTRLLVCNDRLRQLFKLSVEQVRPGTPLRDLIDYSRDHRGFPSSSDEFIARIQAMLSGRGPRTHEVRDIDGRIIEIKNDPMPDGGWVATFEDVTDRRADEEKIVRLAHNDLLTGIANRPCFLDQIEKAINRLRASGKPFSVLMIDLDRFKHVNDSLGHAAGDTLLKKTARRLDMSLRSTDVLARLGGDEFAVLENPPHDFKVDKRSTAIIRESAVVLAARIIDVIGQPYDIDGHKVVIGASIGIAVAPQDGTSADELMKKADLALYRVKSDGRNGYAFFNEELAAAANERRQMETALRDGIARGEFELHFQPQIEVATGSINAMEALIRWNCPDAGLVPPGRFIPLAEDTGMISALGEWILQTACTEATKWPSDVKVAVNVSPVQFRQPNLFDVVLCALIGSGLAPERLEIEITERVLLDLETNCLSTLHQMKNCRISISLDDFGTGYSSLSYLTMFPFDKIKIDRSFTSKLLERPECAAIVCAVINLGRSLDIVTVAEGVETEAQFEALRAAGLSHAQGYLFGRPVPASKIMFAPKSGVLSGRAWRREA